MTLPKAIPTRPVNGFKFLSEIDFFEYRKRLPHFVGEAGYEKPTGEIPPHMIPRVVGFINEVAESQEILSSSMTNSVLVTGDDGVGKTALLQALLNKVALGDVSPALLAKSYYILNLHEYFKLSPADQISQFDACMDFMAKKNSMIIIDRLDDFVASCGPDRARRLMSTLINALENERVSAFTTAHTNNRASIEQTSTVFSRHFRNVHLDERSREDTRNILRQMAPGLEKRHRVIIGDDAITELVRLDQRYEGRLKGFNPNRLVGFFDQTAASVNISKYGKPVELLKQELELAELHSEEETLKDSVKPSAKKMSEVREKIKKLQAEIQPQLDTWTKKFGKIRSTREDLLEARSILAPLQDKYEKFQAAKEKQAERRQVKAAAQADGEDVAPVALEDVPQPLTPDEMKERDKYIKVERLLVEGLAKLEEGVYAETPHVTIEDVRARFTKATGAGGAVNEAEHLLSCEKVLAKNVYGQAKMLRALGNTYRIREVGTSDPTRPSGVILLLGASGCGKTEAIERLAAFDGRPLIDFAMGDYIEKSSVSKLVGAAPGLVGFGETRTLPGEVKTQPKSIVFLDEIEKAHEDFQKPLMQINDKGRIRDEYGEWVNFKDTIVVMASNVLTADDFEPGEMDDDKIVRKKLLEKINPETGRPYFKKEVVGRIDTVVVCNNVTPELAKMILFKNVRDINNGIAAQGYSIQLDDPNADHIVGEYFDKSQGGRSMKQLSTNVLRPLTTEHMLARKATEAPGEDDELKPMILKIDGRAISLDGITMDDLAAKEAEAVRPGTVPQPAGFKAAAAQTLQGGPTQ